jgi:hypothetical protein
MYKEILKHVFGNLKKNNNVLGMKKALSIGVPCPEVPHFPLHLFFFFSKKPTIL